MHYSFKEDCTQAKPINHTVLKEKRHMRTALNTKLWWKICTWHWILNPGLAINEIIFGTRIPSAVLLDDELGNTLVDQQLIVCQHCGHEMPYKNMDRFIGMGLWFGMFCSQCRERIPCVLNVFTAISACIVLPLWYPFWMFFKERYIDYCTRRLNGMDSQIPLKDIHHH